MLHSSSDIVPVNLDGIPGHLKNLARWVLWKPLPQADDPSVLTKSPFDCRFTGDRASSTRPETWTEFATAAAAYSERATNGAGGLMVALGEGLAGVDFDDAIDPATGMPTPEAQRIIDRMHSYTEYSVSGNGVRIFVRAPEAPGKKFGQIEIYSKARFLTVTGRKIPGTPDDIEDRSAEMAALCDELEQERRRASGPTVARESKGVDRLREVFPGVTALGVPDKEILMRASEVIGERFDRLWSGDDSDYDSRSQADLALAGALAFMCGPGEEERVEDLMRQSKLGRLKWDRDDYLPQRTIPRAYEDRGDFYHWESLPNFGRRGTQRVAAASMGDDDDAKTTHQAAMAVEPTAPPDPGVLTDTTDQPWRERPTIVIGPETDAILSELECHLAPLMFQRAKQLVHVTYNTETSEKGNCRRRPGAPMISAVPVEQVLRLMSRHIRFVNSPDGDGDGDETDSTQDQDGKSGSRNSNRVKKRRKVVQMAAPMYLAKLLAKCGTWSHIPRLNGLMAGPFMRPDGTIMLEPGYDPASGYLLLDYGGQPVHVPEQPTAADVARAVDSLRDLVSDFPFTGPEDFSTWLAALLTAAARPAIDGPVPMLWLDANRRGTGKSMLGRLIGIITAGGEPTELSWTADEKEMDSRIASVLNGGDNFVVFDNAFGSIRNPVLERFLTSYAYDFRKYFTQELVKMPNRTMLAITGNNLTLRGDLSRRVIRCRLVTAMECPETRAGFKHADLEAYATANRSELLAAALTILRAHAAAGFAACPVRINHDDGSVVEVPARPVGSFNEWDRVVRHAILRAGLADPMLTQDQAREEDEDDVKLAALLQAWHLFQPYSIFLPLSLTELLEKVFGPEGRGDVTPGAELLAGAIRELTSTAPGKLPEPKTLAYRLKDARDKPVGGFSLHRSRRTKMGIRYWVRCEDRTCLVCNQLRTQAEPDSSGEGLPG